MHNLVVRLFGQLSIRRRDQPLPGLEGRKVQELLCYLLLHQASPITREALADVLWGDSTAAQSRKYLRQALWQSQAALQEHAQAPAQRLMLVDAGWVRINTTADLWLDVTVVEQAAALVQGRPGAELNDEQVQAVRGAVELYSGDLLEGWYQDWCLQERERLQNLSLGLLDKLISSCMAREQYDAGLTYGARILRCDIAHERTHRRLMRLHYLAGDRSAALHQYERCVAVLESELGVRPARQTVELYEQIRTDRLLGPEPRPDTSVAEEGAARTPPDVMTRLRRLQASLAELQGQLQQCISAVEASFRS